MGKLKQEDPEAFKRMTSHYKTDMLSTRKYEQIKQQYVQTWIICLFNQSICILLNKLDYVT